MEDEKKKQEEMAKESVLGPKGEGFTGVPVKGYDFNQGVDYGKLFESFATFGFQATNLKNAMDIVNEMIKWRLSDEPVKEDEYEGYKDPEYRANKRCTIFLGFTSNMGSCGCREVIRYLCEHKMVSCIVTTTGAIEEDIMKCISPHFIGDFNLKGKDLREQGLNRIGNLIVPNKNYCNFEDWFSPLLTEIYKNQKENNVFVTPSDITKLMGEKIDNKESFLYWAAKNDIPVFSPAITDGAVGDVIHFFNYRNEGLVVDIAQDISRINNIALAAKKSGQLIIGGGLIKHHINNANLMRNGVDFSVNLNTATDFDGSDSGASPDEAVSWGKIRTDGQNVKVVSEASITFPILVAETFAKHKDLASRIGYKESD